MIYLAMAHHTKTSYLTFASLILPCWMAVDVQAEVDRKLLSELWSAVVGRSLDNKALHELQRSSGRQEGWTYAQAESVLLEGLFKHGLVKRLSAR